MYEVNCEIRTVSDGAVALGNDHALGPSGKPTAENLLGVISLLQDQTGVPLRVRAVADAA